MPAPETNLTPVVRRVLDRFCGGQVPAGWNVHLMDRVAKRGTGHTPDKKKSAYWNGDIKWISLTDSPRLDRVFIDETDRCISQAGIDNSSAVLHPPGIVVLSRDAGVGKSTITKRPMAVSQHFVTWECGQHLHNLYLYYWLQFLKPEFERIANGSTIKTIGMGFFERMQILSPSEPAQRCIASLLLAWDEAALTLEATYRRRRRLKRGLLQQLLTGQRRFPEFGSSTGRVQTRYGRYPKDWELTTIGAVAKESSRRASDCPGAPVLSCTKHHGLVSSAEYFGRRVHSEDTRDYRLVRRGDFAYATNHIEEGSIGLLTDRDGGLVSPMYTVFEVGERIHAPFLIAVLKTEHYRQMYQARTNASVDRRGGLRWDEFAKIPLALPSIEEQKRIAHLLAECDRELALLRQLHDALKEQKKGLMQKLLTGQVRVPASMLTAREEELRCA